LTTDLFESVADVLPPREVMAEGAVLLRGFARPVEAGLLAAISEIDGEAPFRRMFTPGGHQMSVAMTNCGKAGWVTDRGGYRYDGADPESGKPWPAMPPVLRELAEAAAQEAGFAGFAPDACLINRYEPGSKLGLHQDRDEQDQWSPIVSVSLGVPAVFLWGGKRRADPIRRLRLESGDVAVWGGPARFVYHGIAPVKAADHPLTGPLRINLTFRKVFARE
jgi:DNA oxidative demethylase